jgi:dynein light intermediate chain 1
VRQLRDWIRLLRSIVVSLDDESKHAMEDNVNHWRDRKRSNTVESTSSDDGALPLGPGEWDEPLGMPLCVVCQNTDKMQQLERENGWKDEQFDFIGQYVRTILLKHGGSLIYTMPSARGSLQPLIHTSLGIQSTLQKKELNYEVSNRDKTLVPPNWDSWAKIRMMADNFDPEQISKTWSSEIQTSAEAAEEEQSAVRLYETDIMNPKQSTALPGIAPKTVNGIEVDSKDVQMFLSEQSKILEEYQVSDRKDRMAQESKKESRQPLLDDGRHVEEHIGPVQFNMGGIQVDADDMLKKIKVCFPSYACNYSWWTRLTMSRTVKRQDRRRRALRARVRLRARIMLKQRISG